MQELSNLLLVLGVTVAVATSICLLYATGFRLWTKTANRQTYPAQASSAQPPLTQASSAQAPRVHVSPVNLSESLLTSEGTQGRAVRQKDAAHILSRLGAALCFGGCIVIVLYALWLMIPIFH